MCWLALDRLIALHHTGYLSAPVERFTTAREEIRQAIERHGYDETSSSYVSTFNGSDVDASLLLLGIQGYIPADDPRMVSTVNRVYDELGAGPLLYRYRRDDGLSGVEGAFGICSFWGVEARARAGDVDGATRAFEELLSFGNDVGLYAEETDPRSGAALGNFPQAFTHVGLINVAHVLARCASGQDQKEGRDELVQCRSVGICRNGRPHSNNGG